MDRFVCIHGHFYQPPRENPWLEAIELQDSAYPYHDWNERITAECYAPNAVSRIMNGGGAIDRIVNNYAKMSFNFGPTLLAWIEDKSPELYRDILEADRQSRELFSGHGSAMAQAYNHMIMPLASSADKYTQVLWAICDFEYRFGHRPEGMWLPETAVDLETLDILAELGVKFTVLSPYQARRVRRLGARQWQDVNGHIDPSMAYQVRMPSRRTLSLFFYDGPIAQAVAFEGLLNNGEHFAQRLLTGFSLDRTWPQLVHIATDGESYGHHHRHGEMAFSYAIHQIENNGQARITNYGEFLEKFPPTHEVEIIENTAWSCAHGLERWRSDCGCQTGGQPGWNQKWRLPLRNALDWLRDSLSPLYEEHSGEYLRDPWAARDNYISVLLDRRPENLTAFLGRHGIRELTPAERVTVLKLLEMERHAMLMYTSCGWFFTDLSGLETVQVMQYAGRAIQLAEQFTSEPLEEQFLDLLAAAHSNLPENGDGRQVYEKFVRPAMIDLPKVGAHYAIASLFEEFPEQARIYSFTVRRTDFESVEAGVTRLAAGQAEITSEITGESERLSFGVLHLGEHNLMGGVRRFRNPEDFAAMRDDLMGAFRRADLPQTFRLLDRHFEGHTYSLKQLFRDEQRKLLDQILSSTVRAAETAYQQIYERHIPLMRFLTDLHNPLPRAFQTAAQFAINGYLREALSQDEPDSGRIRALLEEARMAQIPLDTQTLEYTARRSVERLAGDVKQEPADLARLERLDNAVALVRSLPFEVQLWIVENICYELWHAHAGQHTEAASAGDAGSARWLELVRSLGRMLQVRTA
jgi:alpha-amylase/alpha-mannosidase (GH57 family)